MRRVRAGICLFYDANIFCIRVAHSHGKQLQTKQVDQAVQQLTVCFSCPFMRSFGAADSNAIQVELHVLRQGQKQFALTDDKLASELTLVKGLKQKQFDPMTALHEKSEDYPRDISFKIV